MSTVERLSIQGIRSFSPVEPQEILFQRPLTVICGANGTGKSTIIECLKYATTGELPPGCGLSGSNFVFDPDLIEKPTVEGAIKLMVRNSVRRKYVVGRILRSTKKGKGKASCSAEDGTITTLSGNVKTTDSHKKQDMDQIVPDVLGVSPAILNNVIFCHQEESNWPLTEGAELKKKFDDIFESSRYTDALKAMRVTKKSLEDKAKDAAKEVEIEKVKLQQANQLKADLHSNEKDLEETHQKASELREQITRLSGELQVLQAQSELYAETARRISEIDSVVAERSRSIEHEQQALVEAEMYLTDSMATLEASKAKTLETVARVEQDIVKLHRDKALTETTRRQLQAERDIKRTEEQGLRHKHDECLRASSAAEAFAKQMSKHAKYIVSNPSPEHVLAQMLEACKESRRAFERLKAEFTAKDEAKQGELDAAKAELMAVEAQTSHLGKLQREKQARVNRLVEQLGAGSATAEALLVEQRARFDELSRRKDEAQRRGEAADEEDRARDLDLRAKLDQAADEAAHLQAKIQTLEQQAERVLRLRNKQAEAARLLAEAGDRLGSVVQPTFARLFPGVSTKLFDEALAALQVAQASLSAERVRGVPVEQLAAQVRERLKGKHGELVKERADNAEHRARSNELAGLLQHAKAEYEETASKIHELEGTISKVDFGEVMAAHPGKSVAEVDQALDKALEDCRSESMWQPLKTIFTKMLEKAEASGVCPTCERSVDDSLTHVLPTKDGALHCTARLKDRDVSFDYESGRAYKGAEALRCKIVSRIVAAEQRQVSDTKLHEAKRVRDEFKKHVPAYLRVRQLEEDEARLVKRQSELEQARDEAWHQTRESNDRVNKAEAAERETKGLCEALEQCARSLETCVELCESVESEGGGGGGELGPGGGLDELRGRARKGAARAEELRAERERLAKAQQARQRELVALITQHSGEQAALGRAEKEVAARAEVQRELGQLKADVMQASQELTKAGPSKDRLEKQVEALQAEKRQLAEFEGRQVDQARTAMEDIDKDYKQLKQLVDAVRSSNRVQVKAQLEQMQPILAALDKDVEQQTEWLVNCDKEIEGKRTQVHKLKSDILPRFERNLHLLRLKAKLVEAEEEKQRLLADVGKAVDSVRNNAKRLKTMQEDRSGKDLVLSRLLGIQETKEQQIALLKSQLEPLLRVEKELAKKVLEKTMLQMAVSDLGKYHKALDTALMRFHALKIDEINKRIKELWQIIYRGRDIDQVELRAEAKEAANGSAAAKQYTYRVVMRKNRTDLDMRGRCSAGQKVLASIVIRMALAESFSLNCGVLALDEPTTNLDEQNKEGLAQALADIIKARGNNENFELIIITHDEEFVDMLHKSSEGMSRTRCFFRLKRVKDEQLGAYVSKIETMDFEG